MDMKRKIAALFLFSVLCLTSIGCFKSKETSSSKPIGPVQVKSPTPAQTISKATANESVEDAREDLETLMKVTTDTSSLEKVLMDDALESIKKAIEDDLAAGRVKKRNYADIELEFKSYAEGVISLSLKFVDKSYYVDRDTLQQVSKPTNEPKHYALALKKAKNRWKISGIYSVEVIKHE
jgi:hypothetical protein